jgi:hypothetical protein
MARRPDNRRNKSTWKPGQFSLWSQRWEDAADSPEHSTAIWLRHPTSPFVRHLDKAAGAKWELAVQKCAWEYLVEADKLAALKLPKRWLDLLAPGKSDPGFGWLPIRWPPRGKADVDPLVSFEALRDSAEGHDRTIILLAGQRLGGRALSSGYGIRVVAHVSPIKRGVFELRITGMSASVPVGHYARDDVWTDPAAIRSLRAWLSKAGTDIRAQIEHSFGLKDVIVHGIRLGHEHGEWRIKLRGAGMGRTPASSRRKTPYLFNYLLNVPDFADWTVIRGTPINKVPLVAEAAPPAARVFVTDPASQGGPRDLRLRRPTRSEQQLDAFRQSASVLEGDTGLLRYPKNGKAVRVLFCPGFAETDALNKPTDTKKVDPKGVGAVRIRSDEFAALSALSHVKELFERLEAYGLDRESYFRTCELPLKIGYRSGIRPGPGKDGQTINACVHPDGWPADAAFPAGPNRPGLEMHLALADLSSRGREARRRNSRAKTQPLGIAADARWIWHELGHVLLMASVGELEFRFAHSPGDALAAIVADPRSKLADDPEWRGATFPWVFVPRRHDRCVLRGWAWSGSIHQAVSNTRRKGYLTEQILSSTLFRLYLCLGGATRPESVPAGATQATLDEIRHSASHYVVYLIMRGLQLLGSAGIVPADEPDELVSALIDADIGTGRWEVTPPGEGDFQFVRVGGCAHKVIRWAFEAQGMYAPAGKITNGPGRPPPVDIYIADGRPTVVDTGDGEIRYGPGNYAPVPLTWENQMEGPPLWHAAANAIKIKDGQIYVTVGNRGSEPARDVKVEVWCRGWPIGGPPPDWETSGWTVCKPSASAGKGQTIAPRRTVVFGPFANVAPGERYLVIARATCADDPANTDTTTHLPCARLETPLPDLVSGDNNLGLRVIMP